MIGRATIKIWLVVAVTILGIIDIAIAIERYVPSQYATIQAAIDASANGDTVIIATGIYRGAGNRNIDFKGKAITVRSIDPSDPNVVAATIIDCNGTEWSTFRGFYFHNGEDANSILAGLTITKGYAPTTSNLPLFAYSAGGVILCEGSSPTITRCTIKNGKVRCYGETSYFFDAYGAGICCTAASSPKIKFCTITNNWAGGNRAKGGGIYCSGTSNPTIESCSITNNQVLGDFEGCGGGICNSGGQFTVSDSVISENSANSGGGIYSTSNGIPIFVKHCQFINNKAVGQTGSSQTTTTPAGNGQNVYGGGICCTNAKIQQCIISDNIVIGGAGGAPISNGTGGNGGDGYGGGIYCSPGSEVEIARCIISHNIASGGSGGWSWLCRWLPCVEGDGGSGYGGALCIDSNSAIIANCTVVDNSAKPGSGRYLGESLGMGIYAGKYNPTIINCIIWTRDSLHITPLYPSTNPLYCCVRNWFFGGFGNIIADPCFVAPDSNDFHLLPESPCINAGDPNYVAEPNETDMDGELRVMLGRVDMGADEFNPFEVSFDVINKKRIGRTVFVCECNVTLTNISLFVVNNIQLEIVKASENMVITDPNVTFGDVKIGPGESAISFDTCTFQVDRSKPIEPAKIIWKSTCAIAASGQEIQDTASGASFLKVENNAGDSKVDLAGLVDKWLWVGEAGGIPEDINGDGIVNLADFAALAATP